MGGGDLEPIRLLSLFSGIGAFEKALTRLGIPYKIVHYCEIDPYPAKAYSIIHHIPEECNLGDVKKIDIDKLEDFDMMTWGFPCFEKGVLVMTDKGYKPIEDIQAGDKVLTHTNTFQSVVKTMQNYCQKLYEVQIFGAEKIKVTDEHPFYIREMKKEWDKSSRKHIRQFSEPKWVPTKDLNKNHYIGMAINQKSELPKWSGYDYTKFEKVLHKQELDFTNPNLWWVIGRYIGDGWIRVSNRKNRPNSPNYRTIICCGKNEKEKQEIIEKLEGLFHYTITTEKTTYKFHIVHKELTLYLMQFGKRAYNKRLTSDILNLPVNLLQSFLKGYFSADGCFTQKVYKATTVSQELAYGIQACIHKAFQVPCQLYSYFRRNESIIEGRTVKERKHYELVFSLQTKGKEAFYENGYIWVPFRGKKQISYHDYVYNLEVEKDNSYTVYNLIVHNCTDVSVAGKAEGLKIKCENCKQVFNLSELIKMSCPYCGSKNVVSHTRSGLYFEGLKILMAKKPKYSIIENVKGLTNKKNKKNFEQILKDLENAGYKNYWKILNAKDFGVPQNRERIFIVSIRNDVKQDFKFPEGFDSGIRLKHILEPVVDEKYYIPQDKCERLLKELNAKIQLSLYNIIQLVNPSSFQQNSEKNVYTLATEVKFNQSLEKLFDIKDNNAKILQIGKLDMHGTDQVRRVYSPEGLSPTLDTMQGGWRQPKIIVQIPINEEKNKMLCKNKTKTPNELQFLGGIKTGKMWLDNGKKLSRNYKQGNRIYSIEGIACSQTANGGGLGGPTGLYAVYDPYNRKLPKDQDAITTLRTNYSNGNAQIICTDEYRLRIRRLTPLECFLLMGFDKEDYLKLKENGFSDTRLYKMAGNSIVVNVLEHIFMQLFKKIMS